MRTYDQLVITGLALGILCCSTELRAADIAVRTAPPAQIVGQEGACLRWVWQESSWYDDCWWQRHPYIGRSVSFVQTRRR
jgi:hypothetical protein